MPITWGRGMYSGHPERKKTRASPGKAKKKSKKDSIAKKKKGASTKKPKSSTTKKGE